MAGGTYQAPQISPYNSSVEPQDPQTLPLDEIIRRAISTGLMRCRVSMPAIVTKVTANQQVDIQPALQGRYIDQSKPFTLPIIHNVPVWMPRGQDWSFKGPVAVGDTGLALFSDRSLDAWLAGSGSVVDPQDSRAHDLADAIFFPGLVPFKNQTQDQTTDIVLTNAMAQIRVLKSGKFKFTNGTQSLIDLLEKLTSQVALLATTLATESTLTEGAVYSQIGDNLDASAAPETISPDVKTQLDKLKG